MILRRSLCTVSCIALILSVMTPASAWWDAGHMQIAYVAY